MKAVLIYLVLSLTSIHILLAQALESRVIESVSAPLGIAGTQQQDYVISRIIYVDTIKNKNQEEEFQAAPANDNCANAVTITVGAACVSGTTKQSTKQTGETYSCQGAPSQSVWYKFVATAASMYVEVDIVTTSGCYEGSAVWSGSCVPSTNISCISPTANTLLNIHNLTGLTIGSTYYIQVTYPAGGVCGNAGSNSTGTTFCIDVGIPVVCATCTTPCGPMCVFASAPTVAQITASCTKYTLKPRMNAGQSRTECYTFKANATSFSLQMIINTIGCGSGGNVTAFTWTLQSSACGAVIESGTLTNLTATGLTVNQNYVLCYTWTAACEHDAVYPYIVSSAVLPIELLNFQGTIEMKHVQLEWSTASETNNNYFTIERSADGINFVNIGRVEGAGNSTELIRYSYSDYEPLAGVSYYRLMQTDYDGKESYSSTIAVNSEGKDVVKIMPNPVNDRLFLNVDASNDNNLSVCIYNILGQQVYSDNVSVSSGANQFNIDVNNFSKGVYFLKIEYKARAFSDFIIKE